MKNTVYTVLRYIFGLAMLAFGIMGLFQLMEMPPMSEAAMNLMLALMGSGYITQVMQITMILVGLAFLTNRYVALANVVIFPITLNIVLFHVFLDMNGILMGLVVFVLNIYFISQNMKAYKPLLKA